MRRAWAAGLLLGALLAGGCAAPYRTPAVAAPSVPLWLVNGPDNSLTPLDGESGRIVAGPVPSGAAPAQVVAGPGSVLLVRSGDPAHASALTLVSRAGDQWSNRTLPLPPGERATLLAGDGRGAAAVVHVPAAGSQRAAGVERAPGAGDARVLPACHLAVVDLRSGQLGASHPVCAAGDVVTGLALEHRSGGGVAYLAIWRKSITAGGERQPAGGRIVAVNAATGEVEASASLGGLPRPPLAGGTLVLAPASDADGGAPGEGRRLYAVQGVPGTLWGTWSEGEYDAHYATSGAWQILRLHPATLAVEADYPLEASPQSLAFSPEGNDAYAVDARVAQPTGSRILHLDLVSGVTLPLATVPGPGTGGLVTAGGYLYVPDPSSGRVWVVSRHDGRLLRSLATQRGTTGIAAGHLPDGHLPS